MFHEVFVCLWKEMEMRKEIIQNAVDSLSINKLIESTSISKLKQSHLHISMKFFLSGALPLHNLYHVHYFAEENMQWVEAIKKEALKTLCKRNTLANNNHFDGKSPHHLCTISCYWRDNTNENEMNAT